jgi:drug/metabolite transporter, DME family
MTGTLWAAVSGIGFGFFQAFNRRAGRAFDAYASTFILLLISALILAVGSVLTEDLRQLRGVPFLAYFNFSLAGFIHFFLGWTFLTISQNRVGAARTGALVGAAPLFATLIAAFAFQEYLDLLTILGILMLVAGVYMVSASRRNMLQDKPGSWKDALFGLGTALCFAISPIFIRGGLEDLPSPLLGVTIGMGVSALAYGAALLFRSQRINSKKSFSSVGLPGRGNPHPVPISRDAWFFQVAAAAFVGLSTWMRWIALDMAPVGVVIALGRLNVPVVILLSPFLVGRSQEQINLRVLTGAALIVAGSLVLI